MLIRHLYRLVVAGLLALLVVTPAAARAPEPVPYQTAVIRNVRSVTCNGYTIDVTSRVDVTQALIFFDADGAPVRTQVHSVLGITLHHSVSGATRTLAQVAQLTVIDHTGGSETTRGLRFKVTVPGQGTLLLDAGVMVLDLINGVTFHGPHAFADSDTKVPDVLCPALPTI